jgi:hypothetical protein
MTILSRIGQAGVSTALSVYNIGEGLTKVGVGTATALGGMAIDPGLRAFGGLGTGVIGELQQQTGVELIGEERLAAMREASKSQGFRDNELVNMGKDTAISGGLDLFQAREDVIRAGNLLAGNEEAAGQALENKREIGEAQDRIYNPVTLLADVATGKILPRTAGAIFGLATLAGQKDADEQPVETEEERQERLRQAREILAKQETAKREADLSNIRSNIEDSEQVSSISKEQAQSLFRVLAGPDGWPKFGEFGRIGELSSALQAGNYSLLQESWNEWRSKGGTWRNE